MSVPRHPRMTTDLNIYYAMMCGAYAALPDEQKAALYAWEAEHLPERGTSDWPGWIPYIGEPPMPAVVDTTTYRKDHISHGLRRRVFERDAYRCVDCGTHLDLSVDHIIPEAKGGTLALNNLTTRCRSCNSRKGTRV